MESEKSVNYLEAIKADVFILFEWTDEVHTFLADESISWKVRRELASRLKEVEFSKVESFLDHEKISWKVRKELASRLKEVEFSKVESFLMNKSINGEVRKRLASRLKEVEFSKVESFLDNKSIDGDIRWKLASRLKEVEFSKVESFLANKSIDGDIRCKLASRLKEVAFSKAESFLANKSIDEGVRCKLVSRLKEVEFSKAKSFLANKSINWFIREKVNQRVQGGNMTEWIKNDSFFKFITVPLYREDWQKVLSQSTIEVDELISQSLESFPKVKETDRAEIAQAVNHHQDRYLDQTESGESDRTLVLYYRENQGIDPLSFYVAAKTVLAYLKASKSRAFNRVKIVSRFPKLGIIPDFIASLGIEIDNSERDDFKRACTHHANTIHFTDGTPEPIPQGGSRSIVGRAIGENPKRKNDLVGTVLLNLFCCDKNEESPESINPKFAPPQEIITQMLTSIRNLEAQMMKDAGCDVGARVMADTKQKIEEV